VLRRTFGPKRDEVTGEWRKLHNEELNDLYCSLTQYFWGDKIEKNEMGGHVACVEERRGVYRILVGKPEGQNHFGDPGVDGRLILRWIFRKSDVRVRTGSSRLRIGAGGGLL